MYYLHSNSEESRTSDVFVIEPHFNVNIIGKQHYVVSVDFNFTVTQPVYE